MSILKKLEKFFIAFLKWFLSWQTKNITTFPSPYRLTATPRTEEIKNKKEFSKMVASTSSATNYSITRCLSLSKAHYFYCIKIRALFRISLMFLWELKNTIISQNLRELCDINTFNLGT